MQTSGAYQQPPPPPPPPPAQQQLTNQQMHDILQQHLMQQMNLKPEAQPTVQTILQQAPPQQPVPTDSKSQQQMLVDFMGMNQQQQQQQQVQLPAYLTSGANTQQGTNLQDTSYSKDQQAKCSSSNHHLKISNLFILCRNNSSNNSSNNPHNNHSNLSILSPNNSNSSSNHNHHHHNNLSPCLNNSNSNHHHRHNNPSPCLNNYNHSSSNNNNNPCFHHPERHSSKPVLPKVHEGRQGCLSHCLTRPREASAELAWVPQLNFGQHKIHVGISRPKGPYQCPRPIAGAMCGGTSYPCNRDNQCETEVTR
nr:hypothetical protein BaRGS_011078 [Batillaria attramentaria]